MPSTVPSAVSTALPGRAKAELSASSIRSMAAMLERFGRFGRPPRVVSDVRVVAPASGSTGSSADASRLLTGSVRGRL